MITVRSHPERYAVMHQLQTMTAAAQAHEVYRTATMIEFPWETRFGLNLAFYRTFAAPRIAALLARSGEIERQPHKRAYDTGLLMYELIEHGFDHPRGREVVRGLNRMHHRWPIKNEDYLYVLATFVVVPTRWIDEYGWRPTTPVERSATHLFYRELGRRMNISGIPDSYEGFAGLFDEYERRHLAHSPQGARQMAATQAVIAGRLPRPLRFLADPMMSALLDPQLREALGLRSPGPLVIALVRAVLRLRAALVRRKAPRTAGWFEPGRRVRGLYPEGYQLEQLGPATARHPG